MESRPKTLVQNVRLLAFMNLASTTSTDAPIAEAAANALTWHRGVAPHTVTVTVLNGWVTLTGVVGDLQQRGAAERAVRSVRSVRGVSNTLTVVRPAAVTPRLVEG